MDACPGDFARFCADLVRNICFNKVAQRTYLWQTVENVTDIKNASVMRRSFESLHVIRRKFQDEKRIDIY